MHNVRISNTWHRPARISAGNRFAQAGGVSTPEPDDLAKTCPDREARFRHSYSYCRENWLEFEQHALPRLLQRLLAPVQKRGDHTWFSEREQSSDLESSSQRKIFSPIRSDSSRLIASVQKGQTTRGVGLVTRGRARNERASIPYSRGLTGAAHLLECD